MEKKIKVVFLSFYSGEIYRGVETYVYELANKLIELGIDVTVYQNGPFLKDTRYKTISTNFKVNWNQKRVSNRLIKIPFSDYWARFIGKFTRRVLGSIDKDIDIVITTNGSLQVFYARLWCFFHGKKLIAVGQSGPGADDKWNLLCFPDRFIALTDFHKNWAKKFNPFVKVNKIANGVDLNKFNLEVKPIKIDLPKPIVLSVGALEEGKRLDLLIKAVSKTNFSLLLVGSGKLEDKFRQTGNELLKGRFKILSLPFNEMSKVYPAVDLFSYPTVPWESFGIVMVEAMASGLAVVATDDPIRREIVNEAGLFVNPENINEYALALEKAMKTKWGNRPRIQAEKFSWDDIAKDYQKLFMELIRKGKE